MYHIELVQEEGSSTSFTVSKWLERTAYIATIEPASTSLHLDVIM